MIAGTVRWETPALADGGAKGDSASVADRRQLREYAEAALRRAALAGPFVSAAHSAVRGRLRRACELGHARGLRVEQLIILLKDTWRQLPEAQRLSRREGDAVLAHAITACIEEYYARSEGRR